MTVVTIDKKKYVIVPEKQFKQLQKAAAGKIASQKLYSFKEGEALAYKMIDKWATSPKQIHTNKIMNRVPISVLENEKILGYLFLKFIEKKKIATITELKSKSRKQHLKNIRQAFCKILYENTNLSCNYVGRLVNRDHATVIHSQKQDSDKFMEVYMKLFNLFIELSK